MKTRADELKAEIRQLNVDIAWAKDIAGRRPEKAELCNEYAARLEKRRKQVRGYLEREEAPQIKPEGKCDVVNNNGVEWNV